MRQRSLGRRITRQSSPAQNTNGALPASTFPKERGFDGGVATGLALGGSELSGTNSHPNCDKPLMALKSEAGSMS